MNKIFFVMPAYNEQDIIAGTVKQWYPVVDKYGDDSRLVVANDGSKDNTIGVLKDLEKQYPKLIVIDKPNQGHGPTVIYLYKYAINNGADYIFQTDSDGQTNPEEFAAFAGEIDNGSDCVLGNRVVRGDGNGRKMVENVLRTYLWFFFHVWVPDANAPFRLMKASVVSKYIGLMPADFNLPNAVLSACFKKFNEKLSFKVISFKPRQAGVNSINPKKIFKIGYKAIKDFSLLSRKINSLPE